MQYSQKYSLVAFATPRTVGTQFHMADWPVHVTLADVFAVDRIGVGIDEKFRELVSTHPVFMLTVGKDAKLGTDAVVLLENNEHLLALHTQLVGLLEANGAVFNTPQFLGEGFVPHSTLQKQGRLQAGDTLAVKELSLVDMFVNQDWQERKVLANFPLRGR